MMRIISWCRRAPTRTVLDIGTNDWQLPIPLVRRDSRWYFDSREGAQEIVDRRIGGNEIAAIRVSLAYVDAQNDYFERKKQQTGTGEYAQRLVSTPGKHDGLYWPAEDGQEDSPLEPLVAQARDEGYPGEMTRQKPVPYQGYFFRILYSQGAEAPGGAKNYVRNGSMTGGFALVAWPAIYGSSGIMSFIVNQDGIVFQKDFGPETARIAARIHAVQFRSQLGTGQRDGPVAPIRSTKTLAEELKSTPLTGRAVAAVRTGCARRGSTDISSTIPRSAPTRRAAGRRRLLMNPW